jgi:hypothetical protein
MQGVNAMGLTAIDLGLRGAASGVFLMIIPVALLRRATGQQALLVWTRWPDLARLGSTALSVVSLVLGVVLNGRRAPREAAPAAMITGPAVP